MHLHAVPLIQRRFLPLTRLLLALLPGFLLPLDAISAERMQRNFRAIVPVKQSVPIKQSVAPGMTGMKSRSVKVTIPPPPIPEPSNALFPEDSVPEVDIAEDALLIPTPGEEPEPALGNAADLPPETDKSEELPESSPSLEETEDLDGPTLQCLRDEAHRLADLGLTYKFGADHPDEGGMDCSGTMQHLLANIGVDGVPRTSYDQYYWLRKKNLIRDLSGKNASKKLYEKLSPGDLIFWGGTWKSGHKVSHVMIYLGYDPTADTHYVFGARGRKSKGLLGNGVDIFELDPNRGRLVAHGKIPGLVYP